METWGHSAPPPPCATAPAGNGWPHEKQTAACPGVAIVIIPHDGQRTWTTAPGAAPDARQRGRVETRSARPEEAASPGIRHRAVEPRRAVRAARHTVLPHRRRPAPAAASAAARFPPPPPPPPRISTTRRSTITTTPPPIPAMRSRLNGAFLALSVRIDLRVVPARPVRLVVVDDEARDRVVARRRRAPSSSSGTLKITNASPASVAAPRMFSAMSVCIACLATAGSVLFAFGSGSSPPG